MKINLGMSKLGIMLECPMLLRSLLLIFSMNSFALTLDDPNDWRGVTDQVMGGKSVLSIDPVSYTHLTLPTIVSV